MQEIKFQINASAVRRTTFEGRETIVAPVVLLVEGVHAGSFGPLFYPAEELLKSAQFWNGMPLPVYHPEINGQAVSCNTPEITESRSIGRLYNVHYEPYPSPRLKGEAWIDINKSNAIAPDVIKRIENNIPIEISTGLYSNDAPIKGSWNGELYQAIVRDIRPDHLAILPELVGACSISDGCGLRFNEVNKYFKEKGGNVMNAQKPLGLPSDLTANDEHCSCGAIRIVNNSNLQVLGLPGEHECSCNRKAARVLNHQGQTPLGLPGMEVVA